MSDISTKPRPVFETEAEEAQWWFDNREIVGDEFVQAMRDGRATRGAMLRRGLVRTPSIQIDPEDISQAQVLAEKKGLEYQAYLRALIHEALERETKLAS
jgi:hypothetical protein